MLQVRQATIYSTILVLLEITRKNLYSALVNKQLNLTKNSTKKKVKPKVKLFLVSAQENLKILRQRTSS